MSRRPATILQADVARIIRAAKQTGASEVEVRMGNETSAVVRFAPSTVPVPTPHDDEEIIL